MSDIFSPTQRHANMAAIHGKNTNHKPTHFIIADCQWISCSTKLSHFNFTFL